MANSTPSAALAAFGEQLVKELQLSRESSTIAHWMAHYIAERITLAKNANGPEKDALERDCYEAILKLWKHRRFLPSKRPLESFEPILAVLQKLDDDHSYWHFDPDKITNQDGAGDWLRLAMKIDQGSKAIISWSITMAALHAKNAESKWIEGAAAPELYGIEDLKLIGLLADRARRMERATGTTEQDQRREQLKNMTERLKALGLASRAVQDQIQKLLRHKPAPTKTVKGSRRKRS